MKKNEIDELVTFGEKIDVKVSPFEFKGKLGVHFRKDYEYFDFAPAALMLQHIQRTELMEIYWAA